MSCRLLMQYMYFASEIEELCHQHFTFGKKITDMDIMIYLPEGLLKQFSFRLPSSTILNHFLKWIPIHKYMKCHRI